MAVELLNLKDGEDSKHSKETDIWAYGMTLYVKLYLLSYLVFFS